MLKLIELGPNQAHQYKDPTATIPNGHYLVWTGRRPPKKTSQALGGIPATIPPHTRFIYLYPRAIYVQRVLTGYIAPEKALYNTEPDFDLNLWPEICHPVFTHLRPWQRQFLLDAQAFWRQGLQFRKGMIVRMGGGKTLTGLLLAQRFENPWVLAPKYLQGEWISEAYKWGLHCPSLSTYESSHKIEGCDFLDMDEVNAVSNPKAQRTKKARALSLASETVVGGTGTPMSVSPLQIRWLNSIKPGVFPDNDNAFRHMYGKDTQLLEVVPGTKAWVTNLWDMDQLSEDAADYTSTVDISDLLDQIPERTYKIIHTPKPKNFDLIMAGAATVRGKSKSLTQALMCSDGHILTDDNLPLDNDDYKLKVAVELISSMGEPVFVVAHWQRTIQRLREMLTSYNPAVIGGDQDQMELQRFKLGETNVLICPFELTKGLNLQHCRITIIVSNGTSPLQREQMEARTFRPGQTRGCLFIDLCAEGTLDERRLQLLRDHSNQTARYVEAALRKELQRIERT